MINCLRMRAQHPKLCAWPVISSHLNSGPCGGFSEIQGRMLQTESKLGQHLWQLAKAFPGLNFKPLTAEALGHRFLPSILPSTWPQAQEVEWTNGAQGNLFCWIS